MDILNIHVRNWYKAFHVLSTCIWFGSVLSVILVYLFSYQATQPELLLNNNSIMEKIDYWLIVPSSICCYFSGLLMSWKTNWGFIKYKWIVVKLVLGTLLILFGIFFLNTWIVRSAETVTENIVTYQLTQRKLGISMMAQALVIAFLIVISNLKPWGKTTNQ
jgi:uncharacterized membrane protein